MTRLEAFRAAHPEFMILTMTRRPVAMDTRLVPGEKITGVTMDDLLDKLEDICLLPSGGIADRAGREMKGRARQHAA